MRTFLHFVVSLHSRFYTLALIFVFDVNIYSSSLRLFKSDPTGRNSSTSNQSAIFHFSVVFAVTLASRYFCRFKCLDRVKRVIFQASDIAKRLSINFLMILQRYRRLELRILEGVICIPSQSFRQDMSFTSTTHQNDSSKTVLC